MTSTFKMQKVKNYPRPHNYTLSYGHGLETNNSTTIVPIVMNDDAMSTPSNYKANPEHACEPFESELTIP